MSCLFNHYLSLSLTFFNSFSLSLSLTHSHSLSHSLSLTHSLTHSLTLSRSLQSKMSSSLVPAPPFPQCLSTPVQRLEQYCQTLEELGGLNPTSDSALSIIKHAQRHGEDLRASDLITGCPVWTQIPHSLTAQSTLQSVFVRSRDHCTAATWWSKRK